MKSQEGYALKNWWMLRQAKPAQVVIKRQEAEDAQCRAAESLHREYLAPVYAYVARRVPNRQDAEDVTAEVFAAAFLGFAQQKGTEGPFPWLLGIARRKIADALRRQARQGNQTALISEDTPATETAGPEKSLARAERAQRLRDLLAGLPPDQREALLLHYVEELPHSQMASVLGRSPAAVNSLLQRARASVYRAGHRYFLSESSEESEANS